MRERWIAEGKDVACLTVISKNACVGRVRQLMIVKPSLLARAIAMIDDLLLTEGDRKGDVYEYLLRKLTTAGINEQFRTPRHIIDLIWSG
jgi:hypothetical protein